MFVDKDIQCELLSAKSTTPPCQSLQTVSAHREDMLQMFRQQGHFIDVILVLDGKEFPAHSTVLAAFSPMLFVMLLNPTEKNRKGQTIINLDSFHISPKSLVKIIDFMYTGNLGCLQEDVVLDKLLKDAHFLGISLITQSVNRTPEEKPDTRKPNCEAGLPNLSKAESRKWEDLTPLPVELNNAKHSIRKRKHIEMSEVTNRKRTKLEIKEKSVVDKKQLSQNFREKSMGNSENSPNGTVVTAQNAITSIEGLKKNSDKTEGMFRMQPQDIIEAAIRATVSDILPPTIQNQNAKDNSTSPIRENSTECITGAITENSAVNPIEENHRESKHETEHTMVRTKKIPVEKANNTDNIRTKIQENTALVIHTDNTLDGINEGINQSRTLNVIDKKISRPTPHDDTTRKHKDSILTSLPKASDTSESTTVSPKPKEKREEESEEKREKDGVEKGEEKREEKRENDRDEKHEEKREEEREESGGEDEEEMKRLSQWDEFCVDGEYICPHCPDQKWSYLNKLCQHMMKVHGEKPFECFQCGQKFSSKKHFTLHLNKHGGTKGYVCPESRCEKSFPTEKQLHRHRKAHGGSQARSYACPVCDVSLASRHDQDAHLLSVHPESKCFPCPHCTLTCTTHTQRQKHSYSHTDNRRVVCEECGKSMARKNLKEHLLTHGGAGGAGAASQQLQCEWCTYATRHKRYMDSHVKRRHRDAASTASSLPMLSCSHCPFKTFFSADFKTHQKQHESDSKMLTCSVCDYKTTNPSLMKTHRRMHSNERPYICLICTKGFRQSTHLSRHSRLHTGERPFVCTLCGRGFVDKRMLVNHQYNDHANVNQFLCHLCAFECVKQETLRTHMRRAHGIDTFVMNEKKNRREITISGKDLVVHDKPQQRESDSNRMDPLIGDLKQMKEVVSDLINLIPTTTDDPEPLESLLETPLPIDQPESSLDQVIGSIDQSDPSLGQVIGIDQSENPLQEVIGNIGQSEPALPGSLPSLDQSQSILQNDQSDPDSNRILAEDDVKLISKALQEGNVVLHFA